MQKHRQIGLHFRLTDNLFAVAEKAVRLEQRIFQCFLMGQDSGQLISLKPQELQQFREMRTYFDNLYAHISYYANVCEPHGIHQLKRELALAKELGFSAVVLHPGSGKWCKDKQQGMDVLANALNELFDDPNCLPILLENAAHASYTIGGEITDFVYISEKLRKPERLQLCIDTAHAYVRGYDIAHEEGRLQFFDLLEKSVGFDRVALIHLNDTREKLGSYIDQHEVVGRGVIGTEALKKFMMHPAIKHVPIIMEPPPMKEDEEMKIYREVVGWNEI